MPTDIIRVFTELQSTEQYTRAVEDSRQKPLMIFKHSTICPTSDDALDEYAEFAALPEAASIRLALIKVIEQRSVSDLVAETTGITHESPQVLLFYQAKPVWSASHGRITRDTLCAALSRCR